MKRTSGIVKGLACAAAIALILVTVHPVSAQRSRGAYKDVKEMPGGAVGARIQSLIDTINANDADKTRAFIESGFSQKFQDYAPMEQHLEVFSSVYSQSHGFEFYGIRKYEQPQPDTEYVVIVQNKLTRAWEAFVLQIEAAPPHHIAGLQFAPARPPTDLPPAAKVTEAEMVDQLRSFMQRLVDADAFSGSVLLAKDGKVLFKGAYGLASKRFNVPNRVDTKFNLGSMNKMFTGVAIAQLVQSGKLALDDRLSKFLSTDWLPREVTDQIKIKHMLTHTSGLGSYFNDTYMNSSKTLFRELDDYKPLVAGSELAFEPGADWQYSNTGMFLLGVVIEKVTGQDFFDFIRKSIYTPAGMVNSDCYDMDRPVPNLAMGYSNEQFDDDGPQWTNNMYKHVVRGGPAGGGFSTVEDLLRFDIALRSHKLLNPKYTEMVWSGKPELNSPDYGFGFGTAGTSDDRRVGHSGGFSGISSNLDMFLDSGYTAIVMSNYDGGSRAVSSKMQQLIAARK